MLGAIFLPFDDNIYDAEYQQLWQSAQDSCLVSSWVSELLRTYVIVVW